MGEGGDSVDSAKKQLAMVVAPMGSHGRGGAGALRTGWKLIGVGVCASGDVRGGAGLQVEDDRRS